MPWQAPPVGGSMRARPPREGLPPFPSHGSLERPPGVFRRVPAGRGGQPPPEPPDIPSPGVFFRTGGRNNRGALLDPVNVFAYGSVAALVVVLARRARGAEPGVEEPPRAQPADANVGVNPALAPPQMSEENARRFREAKEGRQRIVDFFGELGDTFLGLGESSTLQKGVGGGPIQKRVMAKLAQTLLGSDVLGGGEEDAIARLNEQLKRQREIMAEAIFLALGFVPGKGLGGPGGFVGPQDVADP